LIILLIFLLAGLGFSTYQWLDTKQELLEMKTSKYALQGIYDELDEEYNLAMAELEGLKATNEELDSLLTEKENELTEKKNYINSLLRKHNLKEEELDKIYKLLDQFKQERLTFVAQIDSLQQANQELTVENVQLKIDKEIVNKALDEEIKVREKVGQEKVQIEEKVRKASVLSTGNIQTEGIKIKRNGREVRVSKGSQAEKIKMCFDLLENKIATNGPTEMLVRIINSSGAVLHMPGKGSGVFVNSNGEEMKYTYLIQPIFEGSTKKVCSYWDQNLPFSSGNYQVEIYQEGELTGKSSFHFR